MNIRTANLNEVLGFRAERSLQFGHGPDGVLFTDVTGFHIYGHLGLHLRLAAAQDARNADKYLGVLDEYAEIAEGCCAPAGVVLLEVQGERLHFLQPASAADPQSINALLRFCIALTNTVYDRLKPKAGADWNGFSLAADHGRAIVLATGRDGDDSVISFGDAANRPAKRLARSPAVKSGHLALRPVVIGRSPLLVRGGAYRDGENWIDINVKEPPLYLEPLSDATLRGQINESTNAISNAAAQRDRLINFAAAEDLADHATVDKPTEVQGLCIRADLDNFTRQVEQAFASKSDYAIRALVERFLVIMDFPVEFQKKLNRPVISLPWAGDCATQIIPLRRGETWDQFRKTMPAVAAVAWHDCDGADGRMAEIRKAMSGTRWAVGIAGGDADEGSSGRLLVANLETRARKYRVASGWNVRRSLDAQQAENVVADDTVLPITDYNGLNSSYQLAFTELRGSSLFRCARLDALKRARHNQISAIAAAKPTILPTIAGASVPASKPFGDVQ
jgi:hypothetical protein